MASPSLLEGEDAGGKCPAHIVLSHFLLVLPLGLIQQEARGQRKALGVSHPEQGGEGGPWVSCRKRLGSHGATEGTVSSVSLHPWSPNWGTPRLSKQREGNDFGTLHSQKMGRRRLDPASQNAPSPSARDIIVLSPSWGINQALD